MFFLVLFLKINHLLSFLVTFEMVVFFLVILCYKNLSGEYQTFLFMFFIITVCESIMGLIIFVKFTRFFSKDYLTSSMLMKF